MCECVRVNVSTEAAQALCAQRDFVLLRSVELENECERTNHPRLGMDSALREEGEEEEERSRKIKMLSEELAAMRLALAVREQVTGGMCSL